MKPAAATRTAVLPTATIIASVVHGSPSSVSVYRIGLKTPSSASIARLYRERPRRQPEPVSFTPAPRADSYDCWRRVNGWHDRAQAHLSARLAAHAGRLSRMSVLLHVTSRRSLPEAVASLQAQAYREWELCVAAEAGDQQLEASLQALGARDSRTRVRYLAGAPARARRICW